MIQLTLLVHQPISAQPVFVKRKIRAVKQNTPDQSDICDTTAPPTRMSNFFSRFRVRRSILSHNATFEPYVTHNETQTPIPSTPNYRIRVEMLQLAVLVAMPSRRRSRRENPISEKDPDLDDDEKESDDELPDLVFGVSRVNYRQPSSPTSPPPQPKQ
jgi:hypothetical protein